MLSVQQQPLFKQGDALYEQHGKPLEKEHLGEFIAISSDGKTIIDASLPELMQKAKAVLGPGNFIFKIGDRAVGKWL